MPSKFLYPPISFLENMKMSVATKPKLKPKSLPLDQQLFSDEQQRLFDLKLQLDEAQAAKAAIELQLVAPETLALKDARGKLIHAQRDRDSLRTRVAQLRQLTDMTYAVGEAQQRQANEAKRVLPGVQAELAAAEAEAEKLSQTVHRLADKAKSVESLGPEVRLALDGKDAATIGAEIGTLDRTVSVLAGAVSEQQRRVDTQKHRHASSLRAERQKDYRKHVEAVLATFDRFKRSLDSARQYGAEAESEGAAMMAPVVPPAGVWLNVQGAWDSWAERLRTEFHIDRKE